MQRGRALPFELRGEALAQPLGRWRAQAQLGQRRAQVEAGAADDDRPPAPGEQRVDLGVRELGVLAGAEGGVERQEGDEPVLQGGPLGGRGDAGERLQADVHLQRVGGDRHGVLAGGPQPRGERDRDSGLAHARGAEQRNHSH